MQRSQIKYQVREVIAYSRLVANKLDPIECILLHQWAQQNRSPSLMLKNKFNKLLEEITEKKWSSPEIKYDENLYQYYYNEDTLNWELTINNK